MSNYDKSFEKILKFLQANPNAYAGKKKMSEQEISDFLSDTKNQELLKQKYIESRERRITFKESPTIPDKAVSKILGMVQGYSNVELEKIAKQHKESMTAENMVGNLLESYIASEIEEDGWIHVSGELVKAVDFIKEKEDGSFSALQIKNRDNTENSSSSAIRNNTEIKKWNRTFSKKEKTNWENFPEENSKIKSKLSEEGFFKFIEKTLDEK